MGGRPLHDASSTPPGPRWTLNVVIAVWDGTTKGTVSASWLDPSSRRLMREVLYRESADTVPGTPADAIPWAYGLLGGCEKRLGDIS